MKVLFTLDTLGVGGAETSTLNLINHFSSGARATVCYFYDQHDLKWEYEKGSCNLIFLDLPGRYSFIQGIRKLIQLIRKDQYDIIVTTLYRASFMSRIASVLTGVPLIDTMIVASYGKERKKEFMGIKILKFKLVYWLDRVTSFIPKMWISNSHALANTLGKQLGIPDHKIQVIYRGRESDTITAWKQPAMQGGFHFTSVGRLFASKGHPDLIRAFITVHKKYPDTYLTIYGEGPERKNLETLISTLNLSDSVFLPGRKEHAWNQLYHAHCFILPSHYEGFSGALVEALMTGIPVIASDIPMNTEAVVHQQNGLLHIVNDPEELSLKMEEVKKNYSAAVIRGHAAREEAIIKYDIRKIASAYEDVLRRCAAIHAGDK